MVILWDIWGFENASVLGKRKFIQPHHYAAPWKQSAHFVGKGCKNFVGDKWKNDINHMDHTQTNAFAVVWTDPHAKCSPSPPKQHALSASAFSYDNIDNI